ncbi:MAG: penicillin-binding protein 1A [Gammaproteobacteria bacterium]
MKPITASTHLAPPSMKSLFKTLRIFIGILFGGFTASVVLLFAAYLYLEPQLPSVQSLKDIRLQVPLRVYSRAGSLVAEYGEKRRSPVKYADLPPQVIHAFLAAEDDRFFQHPGVDYQGILRAAFELIRTGQKRQGGSTITMQLARNFFLSREKTYTRKLKEIFLALKINRELTKQEVLDLYLNKIYLGNRAYGVGAAAQIYYGKDLGHLNLAQIAMIAGLPKAPSRDNPIADPRRALVRRNYVLGRMHALGYIDDQNYAAAVKQPVTASLHALSIGVEAPYVAELVRADMVERYGADAYTAGYRVYTTLDDGLQQAANRSLRDDLLAYDRRHGYRGAVRRIDPASLPDPKALDAALGNVPAVSGLEPAVVRSVHDHAAELYLGGGHSGELDWSGLSWARRYIGVDQLGPVPEQASDILAPGDVVYVAHQADGSLILAEPPAVQGALVSLDPRDGAVQALAGGFDYYQSNFNRVVQAQRQPGSSFKPFIYSAALHKGFTAATLINDAPLVFNDPALENMWRPENYSGRFHGPTRLREGLVHSLNLVSIRVLRAIGVDYAIDYVKRFGFAADRLPHNLSLALGSASVTPMEMARGYAVFANGGYRVDPYYIQRVVGANDQVVFQAQPLVACQTDCNGQTPAARTVGTTAITSGDGAAGAAVPPAPRAAPPVSAVQPPAPASDLPSAPPAAPAQVRIAPQAISAQNDYIMVSMMQDVIRRGTGKRARVLKRNDIAGKTGTTNDQRDAWFCGFNPDLVTIAWVGFDQPAPLGHGETGARAALPMWIEFMGTALAKVPDRPIAQPPGIVTVRIDAQTGVPTAPDNPDAMFEIFRSRYAPGQQPGRQRPEWRGGPPGSGRLPEQLF